MKRKIFAIILCATVLFVSGISVAYYNTKTFGFDENAKVFSKDKEKISFLDFEIYYKDVDNFLENAKQYIPDESRVI
ncbi:MAG: hypothetical protein ACI4RR_03950 [Eubacterium sp.]